MTEPYRIRQAALGDIPRIIRLWEEAGLDYRPRGRDTPENLARQFALMAPHFFVAETEGELVGVIMGTHDGRKGWLNRAAVRPDYRRRGLARALVARCEESLKGAGIEIFAALIEPDNATSARVCEALGYELFPVYYYRKKLHEDV